jgi:hypothetical protein
MYCGTSEVDSTGKPERATFLAPPPPPFAAYSSTACTGRDLGKRRVSGRDHHRQANPLALLLLSAHPPVSPSQRVVPISVSGNFESFPTIPLAETDVSGNVLSTNVYSTWQLADPAPSAARQSSVSGHAALGKAEGGAPSRSFKPSGSGQHAAINLTGHVACMARWGPVNLRYSGQLREVIRIKQ